ncbi:TOBE-like domain-containing protein [Alcanivorax sp. JB21]|uniref:sulfate/molybdate ABC transporter ATP-binding protein n=1 Tax=Alcanivorax limicola TaxID=2874102 RepID=UPI001CBF0690|nr:TOBE-like domain-containing protein [Alcanivorax limicola]MBZ2188640.1 TOBE-like domain-containing protein [Alcanivorax limicola]
MSITLDNLSKTFGSYQALEDISLSLTGGELVGLLGPSGSGKTTLLRIIAGLEKADTGRVLFDGKDVTNMPVQQRKVGFVFQQYALFRHMTVFDNVGFGLRMLPRHERPDRAARKARIMELLELVQLEQLAKRYPAQLSGGQRQRVALARALAVNPSVLLLDEPFGALDAKVRKELRRWLRRLHEQIPVTSVFVTHDQEEAMEVSDQVVVMSQGRIEQIGAPRQVYEEPASRFVFDFLGHINALAGQCNLACADSGGRPRWENGVAWLALPDSGCPSGELTFYMRPHEAQLAHSPTDKAHLPVVVEELSVFGATVKLELGAVGWHAHALEVELPRDDFLALGIERRQQLFLRPLRLQSITANGALGPVIDPT